MRLIVTEKDNTAKRIAQILSAGKAKLVSGSKKGDIPVYSFDGEVRVIGLKGHILKVDFPKEYENWGKTDLNDLVNAEIIKTPITKKIMNALLEEAKSAEEVVIATDFDREGELIGVDALNSIREVNPTIKVHRARFSSLTEAEIKQAFAELEDPYYDVAQAGEARQDIDLIWGAALTRAISLASRRLGNNFLSVGRVQSPTLVLLAEREAERMAFKPTPYWQIVGVFESQGGVFEAMHKTERFLDKAVAEAIMEKLGETGRVTGVEQKPRQAAPPAPFNTTSFLAAASSLGFSASSAMHAAESLYMDGYISYPRTDNTHYPPTLDLRGVLMTLQAGELRPLASKLLEEPQLKPTAGKKKATDHPPIYPTASPAKGALDDRAQRLYELVARRFMATLAPPARFENMRATVEVTDEEFVAKGERLLYAGWLEFYPYARRKEVSLPELLHGETLPVLEFKFLDKETQPPPRYGQGSLIIEMEKLGLGTKATRHSIIQNLYDRMYITGDPVTPTKLGMAMAESLKKHAATIATPRMTAELEEDMDNIAEGRMERRAVVDKSRQVLVGTMATIQEHKEDIAQVVWAGIAGDSVVGTCPECGNELMVKKARKTGKRFIGCGGYPDCTVTYSLPPYGMVQPEGGTCPDCGAPKIKIISKGRPPWIICPNFKCPGREQKADGEEGKKREDGEDKGKGKNE